MTRLAVVKLGGSFAGSPRLDRWLEAIASAAGEVVVVPGGGPFADSVREAQVSMRFSDRAAHAMALLAMEQFAYVLADRRSDFKLAGDMPEMRKHLAEGAVPVWRPLPMALAAPDVPASWNVTSDSLAAWLAGRIGAGRLVLVKHVEPPRDRDVKELVADGVVDPEFPAMLRRAQVEAWIAGPDSYSALADRAPAPGLERILPARVDA